MNYKGKHSATKRILAAVLAIVTVLTAVPETSLLGYAKKSDSEKKSWDGTFESGVLGESPEGWSLVSSDIKGNYETASDKDYSKNYQMVISGEKKSGSKALEISGKDKGTKGYVYAESDYISVEAETAYSFNYAIKVQGVEGSDKFYGGKVYVRQYDKDGNELSKTSMSKAIQEDADWENYTKYIQTDADATKVRISFWVGGVWQKNDGFKVLVDDVELEKLSDKKLLNGGFENGSGKNDIYSWHMTSKSMQNAAVDIDYASNYTMERETNGYHGDAVSITRNSWGYVTLDSNKIKIEDDSTYIIDLALRIQNVDEDFEAVRLYVAEYDKNGERLQHISLAPEFREAIDWTEVTGSYTPSKDAVYFHMEFWCGGLKQSHFTASFDDVRITTIKRNTSDDGVNNGNFEEVYDGAVFDWNLLKREDTAFSSTFDGYNGTKGIYCIKTSEEKHGYACMQSNTFEVKAGQEYKLTYMSRLKNQVGNVYIVVNCYFYDAEGNKIEVIRDDENDHRTKSSEWMNEVGYITAPAKSATCRLEFLICGTSYECWIDDVTWNTRDDEADIYGFDAVDNKGNIAGWTVSQPATAKVDTKTYREGTGSLFISHTLNDAYTEVLSDTLIPVGKGARYKFTAFVKSYDCNINSEGIRLMCTTYDKEGKKKGTIEGLRVLLNEESEVSGWRQLTLGVTNFSGDIGYIRPYIYIGAGTMNLWIDDLTWRAHNNGDQFFEDFDSILDDGSPDGWSATVLSGKPSFVTKDSEVVIKADSADDVGMITSKWNTIHEYITCTYATLYATSPGTKAKVTIKFFDYKDEEIVESRHEEILDSTGGEYQEVFFDFLMPGIKYATVELSNEGAGTVCFDSISIVQNEDSATNQDEGVSNWRGSWIWHDEDYHDSINGTPRYFRYHFTLPDNPAEGTLQITADDRMRLWVNGVEIIDDAMSQNKEYVSLIEGMEDYLTEGENVIAISAWNYTSYAGVLFDGYVETEDGEWVDFYSTDAAVSSLTEVEGWHEKDFDDSSWSNCQIVEKVGGPQWGNEAVFDASALVKNIFEVTEYTITEDVKAGDSAKLTMTVIPEKDITANIDLSAALWVRNSETKVLDMDMEQLDGPAINTWKAGEEVTVSYMFEIPDYIGSGKYSLQLSTQQVRISNMDIMNNKFNQAIKLENDMSSAPKGKIVEVNGTYAFEINGQIEPIRIYTGKGRASAKYRAAEYMHESGTCITRLWAGYTTNFWLGYDEYDFSAVDEAIYGALSDHQDTYIMVTLGLYAPDWWLEENPEHCTLASTGKTDDVSFGSDKFYEESTKAIMDLLDHMKEQSYWNRIVGSVLSSGNTAEWLWYGTGQHALDFSEAGQECWKNWIAEKYETDAALQEAWGNSKASLETVEVPPFEERVGDTYATFLDPATQQDVLDYTEFFQDIVATRLIDFATAVTEKVDDNWILGPYYGYINCHYYYGGLASLHTALERVLECEHIDFLAAPVNYNERYDGEAAVYMHMLDGVLANGKAIIMEDDLRLCPWATNTREFFTRDDVGPTYNMSDSISQIERNYAAQITYNVGNWYYDMEMSWFNRKEFGDTIEIANNESVLNLAREKDSQSDICYIIDEEFYENLAYDYYANYDITWWLLHEQRAEFGKLGLNLDSYHMSDLRKGLVPDHKIYIMLSPVRLDDEERAAIEKYLKNDDKVVVWQYICGASDGETFSAENMSEVIGMDVKLDGTKRNPSAVVSDKKHWLTEGQNGQFFGNTDGRKSVSPTAIVTDSKAEVLAYMSDNMTNPALSIKDMGDWTSIYCAVPMIPAEILRNLLEKYDVHMYTENMNDVIFANSNYVGINCAYGGEKEIKLDGTYAVYDVFGQKTYSLSTDTIQIDMEDNSTKLFRLTPAGKHVVYVDVNNGSTSKQAGYQEVKPGTDYNCKIKAEDGYIISEIIVDGEKTEVVAKSYNVTFDDLSNSHFVKVNCKKVSEEVEEVASEAEEFPTVIVWVAMAALIVIAAVVVTLILLKEKKNRTENKSNERNEG